LRKTQETKQAAKETLPPHQYKKYGVAKLGKLSNAIFIYSNINIAIE